MPLPKPNPFMSQEPKRMQELKSTSVASSKPSLVMQQRLLPPMRYPPKPQLNLVDWFNTLPQSKLNKPIDLKKEVQVPITKVYVSQKPQLETPPSKQLPQMKSQPVMVAVPKPK